MFTFGFSCIASRQGASQAYASCVHAKRGVSCSILVLWRSQLRCVLALSNRLQPDLAIMRFLFTIQQVASSECTSKPYLVTRSQPDARSLASILGQYAAHGARHRLHRGIPCSK